METKVQNIPIDKITPDPKQPRKTFNEKKINEMAQSYAGQGIINPIEIDQNYMIICGEIRWRAAKKANLKEVPCIVNIKELKSGSGERLLRQCVENAHHSDMTVMDTARAWKKLLNLSNRFKRTGDRYAGYKWLSEQLGIDKQTIANVVSMLDQPKFVQNHLEKGGGFYRFIIADEAPEKEKEKLKKKIIKNDLTQAATRAIVEALKVKPEKSEEIFDVIKNNSGKNIVYEVTSIAKQKENQLEKIEKPEIIIPAILKDKTLSYPEMMLKFDGIIIGFRKALESFLEDIMSNVSDKDLEKVLTSLEKIENLMEMVKEKYQATKVEVKK